MECAYWMENFPKFNNHRVDLPLSFHHIAAVCKKRILIERNSKKNLNLSLFFIYSFNVGDGITVLGGHFFQKQKRRVWNKSVVAGKLPKD